MNLLKFILILLGSLSLCVGLIGIMVPGLPTTPFLLLTAGLYVKSSDRLYTLQLSNKITGSYIREYNKKGGMTPGTKGYSVAIMWVMIILSTVFVIKTYPIRLLVISMGIIGTIVMVLFVPTVHNRKK